MASRFDVFNLEPKESLISVIYNAAMVKLAFKQSPCFNSCTVCLQRETEWRAALNIAAHYPEFRKPPLIFFSRKHTDPKLDADVFDICIPVNHRSYFFESRVI